MNNRTRAIHQNALMNTMRKHGATEKEIYEAIKPSLEVQTKDYSIVFMILTCIFITCMVISMGIGIYNA